ncbi:MAG: translation initiation factor IF-3 [Rhodothermaceae bacterium]
MRVIDSDGEQLGILPIKQALARAEEKDLDLIEIAPNAKPPVCKIVDFGKFIYEQKRKEKLQKKKQSVTVLKEIRLHPNTDTHDIEFKVKHAINFLENGNKVKIAVIFKGRELAYKDHGRALLERFVEKLEEYAKTEQEIKFEGRAMSTIMSPTKIKKKK